MAMLNKIRRKRFGEILVNEGLITKEQLQEATEIQRSTGDFLGSILLELGHVTETDIIKTMSVQYQLPFIRPALYDLNRKLVHKFKPDFLHLHKVLPIDQIGQLMLLVVTDIPSDEVLAEIQESAEANLAIYIGAISEVDQILKELVPVGEAEEDRIRRRRRGGLGQAGKAAQEDPTTDSTQIKKEVVMTVDTSWESIFDVAEGKVKSDDDD
jgi:type IV pilus assembly protein PilB